MLSNCSAGEDSWESLRLQGDVISLSYRESTLNIHRKCCCWSWNSNTLATCQITQLVKNLLAMLETLVQFMGWRRNRLPTPVFLVFPCHSAGKESSCSAETWVWSLGREDPLEKGRLPTSVFWPEFWRIPWTTFHGVTKSQTQLSDFHFTHWHEELTHWKRPWWWEIEGKRRRGWQRRCLDSTTVLVAMNLSKFWKIVEDRRAFQATVHAYILSSISHIRLFVTPWTVAHQVPLSMGFSRQEHWSRLPCPLPGGLPDLVTESSAMSLALARWVLYHQHHLGGLGYNPWGCKELDNLRTEQQLQLFCTDVKVCFNTTHWSSAFLSLDHFNNLLPCCSSNFWSWYFLFWQTMLQPLWN